MEDSASLNAFKNGQIDAVGVGTRDRLAQVQGQPGTEIRKGPSLQLDYFTLNGQSPLLSDPLVRKAVFEAIDRVQIAKIHFNGLDYTADPQGSMLLLPFQKRLHGQRRQGHPVRSRAGEKDLDAAGWPVGPDGTRAKNGQRLDFTYVNTGDDPVGKAIAGGTAAMLKNVGIQMDIRQVPSGDFSKIVTGKQFDMFYSGISQSDPYGLAYICQVYCSNTGLIKSGVNDPKNDDLIRSVNTLPTPEQQYAKATEAETAALATYGILPTVNLPAIIAVKTGWPTTGPGGSSPRPPK